MKRRNARFKQWKRYLRTVGKLCDEYDRCKTQGEFNHGDQVWKRMSEAQKNRMYFP